MTQYTWLLWDALAVLVLIWAVEKAARKGFVRAVLELLSCVVAAMLSQYCAPLLAPRLYEWFGRDLARMAVEKQIESSGLLDGVGGLAQSVTGMLGGLLRYGGGVPKDFIIPSTTREAAELLVDQVLAEPLMTLLQSLSFMLIFSLALFILRRFSGLLSFVQYLPVVGTVNTFLGGVMGVAQGLIYLLLLALGLYFVILITGGDARWLSPEIVDQTFVVRFFYSFLHLKLP
ncbi:CvpA family protein [Oscillospiraceae bacterium MB08-C2-2]|nr:CvpA family protein [Oscillospiraceae bacterium MB08-C2-2]